MTSDDLAAAEARADAAEAKFKREQAMHGATRRYWEPRAVVDDEPRVLSLHEHGVDAVMSRDFYRCPNTGEWVYRWADERIVALLPQVEA